MTIAEVAGDDAPARFRQAYEAVLPQLTALPPEQLLVLNVEVLEAVTTVLGCLPKIRSLRADAEKQVSVDLRSFDELENYTLALAYANAQLVAASEPSESLPALSEQGANLRGQLVEDVEALAKRGLVDGARLAELKGPVGYRNLAHDLMALSALLRTSWERVQGRTAVTAAELDHADKLADRLLRAMGEREQAPERIAVERNARQRAFTLFFNAYDDVRRVITFVRWEQDDADEFAPSLYSGKGRGNRGAGDTATEVVEITAQSQSEAGKGNRGRVAADAASPMKDDSNIAAGMPGSSPYES